MEAADASLRKLVSDNSSCEKEWHEESAANLLGSKLKEAEESIAEHNRKSPSKEDIDESLAHVKKESKICSWQTIEPLRISERADKVWT